MNRSVIISSVLHAVFIFLTAMSLPFLTKKPIDLPPIVSIELIQITDKTNIPFAPKAKKIIEEVKKKRRRKNLGLTLHCCRAAGLQICLVSTRVRGVTG